MLIPGHMHLFFSYVYGWYLMKNEVAHKNLQSFKII